MSKLFDNSNINGLILKNRFVRSATWEGMADKDGSVSPGLIEKIKELAKGGVGLIISSHSFVQLAGMAGPGQVGVHSDEMLDGLKNLTEAVHENGGKIVAQLAHAGNFSFEEGSGITPMVASYYEGLAETPRHQLTTDDINRLVSDFANAARRAKEAGFDGVQIHSAHGYLLSQMLSPAYNRRTDSYGGAIENRARIHLEIFKAIREIVGPEYPILIKINCEDFTEDGLALQDSIFVCKQLADAGLDAIELSGGTLFGGKLSPSRARIISAEDEAYFRDQAKALKREVKVPLILVGGMRSLEVAEELTDSGVADYISLSRPLIREPGLIKRWESGDRARATCKSDNLCFRAAFKGGVYCVTEERERSKA